MPRDSKKFRQTTLFDPQSSSPVKSSNKKAATISRRKKYAADSTSDDISAVKLAPLSCTTPLPVASSSDNEDVDAPTAYKERRKMRVSSASASENELRSPVKRRKLNRIIADSDADDTDDFSRRSRLHRRYSPEHQSSAEEDLAQLADEVDEDRILESRLRTRHNLKSAFQQNLEKLKRRKLKLKNEDEKDDDDDDGADDGDSLKLFKGSKLSNIRDDDSTDPGRTSESNSSEFIVEDEASTFVQLPAEFSMETHQEISHQFKKIFQFFVHVATQPPTKRASFMEAHIRDEQYFSIPLQMIRRKLSGIRDSLVASSVWRSEFKKNLEKFPNFELVALDFAVPSCDACHLGGRMSTLLGRLSGSPYNRSGFEDTPPRRSDKNHQSESREFHLGRFCARRTQVYHEFSHWEHSLFHSILREIEILRDEESSKSFHIVAFFGGKKPPDDLQDADGLCDWLDERNIIDIEWQKLKKIMEDAQHLELGSKRGDTDD